MAAPPAEIIVSPWFENIFIAWPVCRLLNLFTVIVGTGGSC
jgi:hypothetical protein